jgi:hypothetical protein
MIKRLALVAACAFLFLSSVNLPSIVRAQSAAAPAGAQSPADLILSHLSGKQNNLCYIEASPETGWYAQDIASTDDLDQVVARYSQHHGLIVPIFPTVYSPGAYYKADAAYYDYLLKDSGIREGDKVLVIGSGSGSDSWVAWQKSKAQIYAIDINPLAVANTKATAQIANFSVDAIQGDIRTMSLPGRFSGFDYVLWNMPFLDTGNYEESDFHDHEQGDVLENFQAMLPRLLKKDGKAVLLNTNEALQRIHFANRTAIKTGEKSTNGSDVYVIAINLGR